MSYKSTDEKREYEMKRKTARFNKSMLKSKNRKKIFTWMEYIFLLAIINFRKNLFHLNGYWHYTKHYRFTEATINKLISKGFLVFRRDSIFGFQIHIYW